MVADNRSLPNAADLRYFLEIARTLNLSRAAVRLGITQPALTQAMKKLESQVGSKLLIRTHAGVRLTKAGERVAGRAAQLFEVWESVVTDARFDETEVKGRFRVGCHPAVGGFLLPRFFRDLASRAPGLEIQLVHDLSRRVTEAVIDYRIDLAFVVNPVPHPDLVERKLGSDTFAVFEAKKGRYESDLFGDPDLLQTQAILKKIGPKTLRTRRFVGCSSLEVIRTLVASGAGYGILPTRVAQSSSADELHALAGPMPTVQDEIFVVYRAETLASHAGKALLRVATSALTNAAK